MSRTTRRINDREDAALAALAPEGLDPQVHVLSRVDPAAPPGAIPVAADGRRAFLRRSLQIGLGLTAAALSMGSFQVCNHRAGQNTGGGGGGSSGGSSCGTYRSSSSCSCVGNCTCNPVCRCTSVCSGKAGCSCNYHRST